MQSLYSAAIQYQSLEVVFGCVGFIFQKISMTLLIHWLVLRRSQIVFKGGTLLPLFLGTKGTL